MTRPCSRQIQVDVVDRPCSACIALDLAEFSIDDGEAVVGTWVEVRKLVDAFYTHEFSFGQFMRKHPHHGGNLTDILIGRIFHEHAGLIFDDMEPAIATAIQLAESDTRSSD